MEICDGSSYFCMQPESIFAAEKAGREMGAGAAGKQNYL